MTILTPKGYSSARQPRSERPQPEPVAEAVQPPQEAGAPRVELNFPPQVIGINCPSCGTPYPVQVFSVVDAGQDPILKSILLSGQLNVAVCPRCNTGGAIATPLLYHDPEHDFLGVHVPEQIPVSEQQQAIGQLSKRLMDGLPQEARRGYMLTPKQFLSYQSLVEAILEKEGVTREMLDRQRRRLQLIEQSMAALRDPEGLRLLVQENDARLDDEFFGLLHAVTESAAGSGDSESAQQLTDLRERLIDLSTWGEGVRKQRAAIAKLKEDTTPRELVDMIVEADDERVIDALVTVAQPLVNYAFYQELTSRMEAAERRDDSTEASRLRALRQHILELEEQLAEFQRSVAQQASDVLGEILAAKDIRQALAERAPYIDQNFLAVLAANLQEAERRGASAAVKRLQAVWDGAMDVIQEGAPPEVRLINRLLQADYPSATRQILAEARDLVGDELIAAMDRLAQQLADEGDEGLAKRVRQIRSQAQLMR